MFGNNYHLINEKLYKLGVRYIRGKGVDLLEI